MYWNLFTYGTLQFPEIMEALTGRWFTHREGILRGYQRFQVKGECYPGILADKDSAVSGIIYLQVDPLSMQLLDYFEEQLYERVSIQVVTGTGTMVPAQTYIVPTSQQVHLSQDPWDPHTFEKSVGHRYRAYCRRFYRDYLQTVAKPG